MSNAIDRGDARRAKALEVVGRFRGIEPASTPDIRHPTVLGPLSPNPTGVVYFLHCAKRLKIGFASDVKKRMEAFVTHCPLPATLLMTAAGVIEDEAAFHRRFAAQRVNGEWFDIRDDLEEFLFANMDDDGTELFFEAVFDCQDFFAAQSEWYSQFQDSPRPRGK